MNDGLVEDELDCAVSRPRVADLQEMKAKREPGMIGRDFLGPFQLWTTMYGGVDGLRLHEELHWERSGYSNIINLTQQPDTITTILFSWVVMEQGITMSLLAIQVGSLSRPLTHSLSFLYFQLLWYNSQIMWIFICDVYMYVDFYFILLISLF